MFLLLLFLSSISCGDFVYGLLGAYVTVGFEGGEGSTKDYFFPSGRCVFAPSMGNALGFVRVDVEDGKDELIFKIGCDENCGGCEPYTYYFSEKGSEGRVCNDNNDGECLITLDGDDVIFAPRFQHYYIESNSPGDFGNGFIFYTDNCHSENMIIMRENFFDTSLPCVPVNINLEGEGDVVRYIRAFANADGITTSTIRYYEEIYTCEGDSDGEVGGVYTNEFDNKATYTGVDTGTGECFQVYGDEQPEHADIYSGYDQPLYVTIAGVFDYECGDDRFDGSKICSGNGDCVAEVDEQGFYIDDNDENKCKCDHGDDYFGNDCLVEMDYIAIGAGSAVGLIILVLCVCCCCCCVICVICASLFVIIPITLCFLPVCGCCTTCGLRRMRTNKGKKIRRLLLQAQDEEELEDIVSNSIKKKGGSSSSGSSKKKNKKKKKKNKKYTEWEELAEPGETYDEKDYAHMDVDKSLFEIDPMKVKLTKVLGQGGGGAVIYRAEWNSSEVAVKLFKTIALGDEHDFREFEKEVKVMASISHPNVLRFFGCLIKPELKRVGIVMELAENGDLQQYLRENPNLPIQTKFDLILGICKGIYYLHTREIVHRDLKLGNVLVDSKGRPKLIDFGLSRIINRKDNFAMTKMVGTSWYMAPEITLGKSYDEKIDIFSFAIMFYQILTEEFLPYGRNIEFNVEVKVATDSTYRPVIPEEQKHVHPKWCLVLMKRCWDSDPDVRLSIKRIIKVVEKNRNKVSPEVVIRKQAKKIQELEKEFLFVQKKNKKLKKEVSNYHDILTSSSSSSSSSEEEEKEEEEEEETPQLPSVLLSSEDNLQQQEQQEEETTPKVEEIPKVISITTPKKEEEEVVVVKKKKKKEEEVKEKNVTTITTNTTDSEKVQTKKVSSSSSEEEEEKEKEVQVKKSSSSEESSSSSEEEDEILFKASDVSEEDEESSDKEIRKVIEKQKSLELIQQQQQQPESSSSSSEEEEEDEILFKASDISEDDEESSDKEIKKVIEKQKSLELQQLQQQQKKKKEEEEEEDIIEKNDSTTIKKEKLYGKDKLFEKEKKVESEEEEEEDFDLKNLLESSEALLSKSPDELKKEIGSSSSSDSDSDSSNDNGKDDDDDIDIDNIDSLVDVSDIMNDIEKEIGNSSSSSSDDDDDDEMKGLLEIHGVAEYLLED